MKEVRYIDSQGREFKSIIEACKIYNIAKNTVYRRLAAGWSFKDAIESPPYCYRHPKPRKKRSPNERIYINKVVDSSGNEFLSMKEACTYYNISYATVNKRIQDGMDRIVALETPVGKVEKRYPNRVSYTDSLGNKFKSLSEAYKHWNISQSAVRERLKNGMSLAEAIETPKQSGSTNIKPVKLSNGDTFKSRKEAYENYGLSRQAVHQMMHKKGMSFEEVIEYHCKKKSSRNELDDKIGIHRNKDNRSKSYTDSKGNTFSTLKSAYKFYNTTHNSVKKRLKAGWEISDAIEIPRNCKIEDNLEVFYRLKDKFPLNNTSTDKALSRLRAGCELSEVIKLPD